MTHRSSRQLRKPDHRLSDLLVAWLVTAVVAVCGHPIHGATQSALAHALSVRTDSIIAAAEAAGASYARAQRARPLPMMWDSTAWWGTAERRCVEARGMGPVRSGDFIIGGELGGDPPIFPRVPAKIWWAPLHNSESMDSLILVGERLSSPMRMRQALGTLAFPGGPGQGIPSADHEYFYPSGTIIPDWGRWLLVASSGANWGCFVVTLGLR